MAQPELLPKALQAKGLFQPHCRQAEPYAVKPVLISMQMLHRIPLACMADKLIHILSGNQAVSSLQLLIPGHTVVAVNKKAQQEIKRKEENRHWLFDHCSNP